MLIQTVFKIQFLMFTVCAVILGQSEFVQARSAVGVVRMTVLESVRADVKRDFEFTTIDANKSEVLSPSSNKSAVLQLSVAPMQLVSIVLPTTVTLHSEGSASIEVTNFKSSVGNSVAAAADGSISIQLGAVRKAQPQQQVRMAKASTVK